MFGAAKDSPTSKAVFTVYEDTLDDRVDARLLVLALSSVLPVHQRKKAKFAFRLFDEDQTGDIPRAGILDILKANHLSKDPEDVAKKADLIVTAAASPENPDVIKFDSMSSTVFPVHLTIY